MGGKKIQHHTAKELAMKDKHAKMKNGGAGGGEDGKLGRKAPKEGKKDIFLKCTICMTLQPSIKSMEIHHESKHAKIKWDPSLYDEKKDDEKTDEKTDELQDEDGEGENEEEENEEKQDEKQDEKPEVKTEVKIEKVEKKVKK